MASCVAMATVTLLTPNLPSSSVHPGLHSHCARVASAPSRTIEASWKHAAIRRRGCLLQAGGSKSSTSNVFPSPNSHDATRVVGPWTTRCSAGNPGREIPSDDSNGLSNTSLGSEESALRLELDHDVSPILNDPSQEAKVEPRVGRRSLALFLPLLAAVSATSRAAAEVAAPELLAPPPSLVPSVPAPLVPKTTKVRLDILEGCTLGVSIYPDFGYNPMGGGGVGTAVDLGDGRLKIDFDPKTLYIPPLSFDSTTFVGLPLPPPLKIRIVPRFLSGYMDTRTGQVNLVFKSKFYFSAGPIYSAPPLTVETVLTTDSSVGSLREGEGKRLDSDGQGTLVAVAQVPPVNDGFLDRFLGLPTDVLAVLPAKFSFEQ